MPALHSGMSALQSFLRAHREKAGLSQLELASQAGVTRQALIAIEAGRQVPSTGLALNLARVLHCKVEDLFRLSPDSTHNTENIFIAGCAPLMGILAEKVSALNPRLRVTWVKCNNRDSLAYLKKGLVHIAGVHAGQRQPSKSQTVNLLRWRLGIVFAQHNPLHIKSAADLARPEIRLAVREEGSGAHKLLLKSLKSSRFPRRNILAYDHQTVADLVRVNAADAGITIESAALMAGLEFIPLAEESFDLMIPESLANGEAMRSIVDMITHADFKREATAMHYDMSQTGKAA